MVTVSKKKRIQYKRSEFTCKLCTNRSISFSSRGNLYNHYSRHFKTQLLTHLDGNICIHCGREFPKLDTAIVHAGGFHDLVDEYLPKEYHVPRSVQAKTKESKCVTKDDEDSTEEEASQLEKLLGFDDNHDDTNIENIDNRPEMCEDVNRSMADSLKEVNVDDLVKTSPDDVRNIEIEDLFSD